MCLLLVAPAVCFLAFECNRKRIRFYTDPVPSRRFIAGQFAGADLATDVQSFFCCALHGKSSAHKERGNFCPGMDDEDDNFFF